VVRYCDFCANGEADVTMKPLEAPKKRPILVVGTLAVASLVSAAALPPDQEPKGPVILFPAE
jgi:hypothetical protein